MAQSATHDDDVSPASQNPLPHTAWGASTGTDPGLGCTSAGPVYTGEESFSEAPTTSPPASHWFASPPLCKHKHSSRRMHRVSGTTTHGHCATVSATVARAWAGARANTRKHTITHPADGSSPITMSMSTTTLAVDAGRGWSDSTTTRAQGSMVATEAHTPTRTCSLTATRASGDPATASDT